MRAGAGLVTLGIAESLNPILETQVLEVMTAPLPGKPKMVPSEPGAFENIKKMEAGKTCLVIGPGIGQAGETQSLVNKIISQSQIPVVIDADGPQQHRGTDSAFKKPQTANGSYTPSRRNGTADRCKPCRSPTEPPAVRPGILPQISRCISF